MRELYFQKRQKNTLTKCLFFYYTTLNLKIMHTKLIFKTSSTKFEYNGWSSIQLIEMDAHQRDC